MVQGFKKVKEFQSEGSCNTNSAGVQTKTPSIDFRRAMAMRRSSPTKLPSQQTIPNTFHILWHTIPRYGAWDASGRISVEPHIHSGTFQVG